MRPRLVCYVVLLGGLLAVADSPVGAAPADGLAPAALNTLAAEVPGDDVQPAPPPPDATRKKLTILLVYCASIVVASLGGGYLPSIVELDHNRMQTIISFVGGLMLGIGVFHMLPHSVAETGSADFAAGWMMAGMVLMFFLLRFFHFHQHDVVVDHDLAQPVHLVELDEPHDHDHDHDHSHDHGHDHGHHHGRHAHHGHGHDGHTHHLSWVGITIGLSLHTLLDGLALGATVEADSHHPVLFSLFGVGTFLAILLHKPLDALSITSLMTAGGWSETSRNLVNVGFSLMCPLGAVAFVLGVGQFSTAAPWIVGAALAAAGGVFVCISLSDLLPEMEFHSHNRVRLSVALMLGILLAWGIGFLEPSHSHAAHRRPGSSATSYGSTAMLPQERESSAR